MLRVRYETIEPERVLGIDPTTKGFGYVVVEEEPVLLVDWGVRLCAPAGKTAVSRALEYLITRYDPTTVVIEDLRGTRALRTEALVAFMGTVAEVLGGLRVGVYTYSRGTVRGVFGSAGAFTKDAIARELAVRFPELHPRVPKPRAIWESEDARMSIFDALAFALTHLAQPRSDSRQTAEV